MSRALPKARTHSMAQSSPPYPKRATDRACRRTVPLMGTFATIDVVGPVSAHNVRSLEVSDAIDCAFEWFHRVEQCCTRFESDSEVMRLVSQTGTAVPVSAILFEAVQFSLAVARETDGAFDPTVGQAMESRGFNREYRTGKIVKTDITPGAVSYRDVQLDPERQTIRLLRPLILDLGAVAKGLAIDLAARALGSFENFVIDAGGDLYLAGCNAEGEPWSVGIRHPRQANQLLDHVRVSNRAVCTSGDYESRTSSSPRDHHILDPRSGSTAQSVASATAIAPTAMMADALSTAAFVLGPIDGVRLFEKMGIEGLLLTSSLERFATKGFTNAL